MNKLVLVKFRGSMYEKITTTKEYLVDIEQRFVNNEKAKIGLVLTSLI